MYNKMTKLKNMIIFFLIFFATYYLIEYSPLIIRLIIKYFKL
jgi:hypothetical protein